ncbi:MAG: J domain-containing protein [Lachnospiraceae bacterium]|nr:J domain-containing protein [Lachnospiraceae bacterium]
MTEFDLLGIEVTTDKEAISEAYRKELTKHHPEEDPEGFKALREAYEKALDYAEEHTVDLDNPLSVYMGKVADVYEDYSRRIDLTEWEYLLNDPLVTGFETEKETRLAILSYIMDGHDMLKDQVWTLIETTLLVGEHAEELSENLDPEFIQYILLKKEGQIVEFFDYDALTGYSERDTDGVIDDYISSLKHFTQPGTELTEEILEKLRETGLQHPLYDLLSACYLIENRQADDALMDKIYGEANKIVGEDSTQLRYRAYKVMALIAEKKNEIRDAFYYARMAAYPRETPDIVELESKYGDQLSLQLKELDQMDENTLMVFLVACYMSAHYQRALIWTHAHQDALLDTSEFHYYMHLIYGGMERFTEAEEELQKAEDMAQEGENFLHDWIKLYQIEEDYESIIELCEDAHEKAPEDLGILDAWQDACEKMEWYKEVVDIMHMARELESDYAPFHIRAAKAYAESEYYRDAVASLESAPVRNLEMYRLLAEYYFKLFADDNGHCGPEEAKAARWNAQVYQQQAGEDWELVREDGWMKILERENGEGIALLEHALELLQEQKDTMDEEEFAGKTADIYYRMGRGYLDWREEKNAPAIKEGVAEKALDVLEKGFAITTEYKLYYDGLLIFSRIIEACHVTGQLDRGLKLMLDREKLFIEREEDTQWPYTYFMDWMIEELSIHKGDLETAKARLEKRVGASSMPTLSWENSPKSEEEEDEIEVIDVADCEDAVLCDYVIAPEMHKVEEKQNGVRKAIRSVINWIENAKEGDVESSVLIPYVLSILKYGPAFSTDYEDMFRIGNDPKVAKEIGTHGKPSHKKDHAQYMMRIAYYAGKEKEMQQYALKYENLVTKNTPYCCDYDCTLEQACKGPQTCYTRMMLVELGEARLYQGKIEEAKAIVEEVKDHPMCWYCSKTGCLEYYLLQAEMAFFEGDYDKMKEFCELTNSTEWSGHEEIATGLLNYLENKK